VLYSKYLGNNQGQIATAIILPGDTPRAKHITETMLDEAVCFNQVHGIDVRVGGMFSGNTFNNDNPGQVE